MKWHEAGCSQDKEDHAWKVIQKNDTLVVEYITTWKGIRYKNCHKIYPRYSQGIIPLKTISNQMLKNELTVRVKQFGNQMLGGVA